MINWEDFPYRDHFKIPQTPITEQDIFPKDFEPCELSAQNEIVWDLGAETVGKCYFTLFGNAEVKVVYGEVLDEVYSSKEQNSNDWYTIPKDRFIVVNEKMEYASSSRRGFRYVRLICEKGSVNVSLVRVRQTHYKVSRQREFVSEDKQLLDIWDICRRTTLLCMQEFFEDGIKRDGILWVGDARLQALCAYAVFGDCELTKTSLMRIANSQRADGAIFANAILSGAHGCPHNIDYMFDYVSDPPYKDEPSFIKGCGMLHYVQYSMDFINMAWEYYEFSGDLDTINELFEFLKRALDYLFTLSEAELTRKLLPSPSQAKRYRQDVDQGGLLSTYYAFGVYAMKNFVKICELLSQDEEKALTQERILAYTEKVRKFFENGECLDTDKGGVSMYPVTAPAMAYLSGCISKEEYLCAINNIKGKEASVVDGYWMYFTLRAMFEAELVDEAMEKLRSYWGTMLKLGATTCYEHLNPDDLYVLEDFVISRCHGWSAGAAELFVRFGIS